MTASTMLRYTASREADNALAIARVAAAGRVMSERAARRAKVVRAHDVARRIGQWIDPFDPRDVFCFICGRCTDHTDEHSPEQLEAYRRGED